MSGQAGAVKALSERAKRRLRLAAGLLRSEGVKFDCPRDKFYDEIQQKVTTLAADRQASLKALVDWLEDYERAEEDTGR
jgi:hypothetical protein